MKRLAEQRQAKISELTDDRDISRHNEAVLRGDIATQGEKLGASIRDRDEQIEGLRTKNDELKHQAGDLAHQLAQVQDVARTAATHRDEAHKLAEQLQARCAHLHRDYDVARHTFQKALSQRDTALAEAERNLKRARHELAESRSAHASELSTQAIAHQRHRARFTQHIATRDTALAAADKLVKVLLDDSVNIIDEELEAYADATAEVEPLGTEQEQQRLLEKDRTVTTETIGLVKSISKMPWLVGPALMTSQLGTLRKELNI